MCTAGETDLSKWKVPGGSIFQPEKHAWGFPVQLPYKRPLRFGNLARGVGQGRAFRGIYICTFKDSRSGFATKNEYLPSSGPQFPIYRMVEGSSEEKTLLQIRAT